MNKLHPRETNCMLRIIPLSHCRSRPKLVNLWITLKNICEYNLFDWVISCYLSFHIPIKSYKYHVLSKKLPMLADESWYSHGFSHVFPMVFPWKVACFGPSRRLWSFGAPGPPNPPSPRTRSWPWLSRRPVPSPKICRFMIRWPTMYICI